jgi:hypothetical protein
MECEFRDPLFVEDCDCEADECEFRHNLEIWRPLPIKEFAHLYEISSFGRVRRTQTERIMNPEIAMGYRRVCVVDATKQLKSKYSVHRLVAMTFCYNSDPEHNTIVNHIDGVRTNNHFDNLEWCTITENNLHARETGLKEVGGTPVVVTFPNGTTVTYPTQRKACVALEMGENTMLRALKTGNPTKKKHVIVRYKDSSHHKKKFDLSGYVKMKKYPGYYINRKGQIFSTIYERLLKYRLSKSGYWVVGLCKNKLTYTHLVHRLVAEEFIPNPKNLPVVNHIDHDKENINVDNLEWTTYKENTQKFLIRKKLDPKLSE